MIDVEAGGHRYQEMHVDGGAVAQTFLIPVQVSTIFRRHAPVRDRQIGSAAWQTGNVVSSRQMIGVWPLGLPVTSGVYAEIYKKGR
jgi:hypothetical protein